MRRSSISIIAFTAAAFFIFFAIHCGNISTNPFSQENAKVTLFLISSDFIESDSVITDTVDKKMRLKVCLYLTQHIDSTIITIGKTITSRDTAIICRQKERQLDTVVYTLSFPTAGDRTVIATAYVGKNLRPTATATIHIVARPIPNRKPVLSISGNRDIVAGQTCTLELTAVDPDSGQTTAISITDKPANAAFDGHTFSWNTTLADTGTHTITFITIDNGSPSLSDSLIAAIIVTAPGVNRPPKWANDTLFRNILTGKLFSLTLEDKCSDPDNDVLRYSLLPGPPADDTILNNTYSYTPSAKDTGVFFPDIAVFDPQNASDTMTLSLIVTAPFNDTLPPIIKRFDPIKDSASVNANSYTVKVVCKDQSGVASVVYTLGAATVTAQKGAGDTVWSANVTNLVSGAFNYITIIATDSSSHANKDTLVIAIKYDPTMADSIGPIIFQKSGPAHNSVITDSIVTIVDSLYDPSGIDSVYWTLNNAIRKPLTLVSGKTSWFSLTDTLRRFKPDTITVYAVDKATAHNKSSQTIILNHVDTDTLPPIIKYLDPVKDTTCINANSYTVKVLCKDQSGVASVVYALGAATFIAQKGAGDTVWSANVIGLVSGAINTITVAATDASTHANKATLVIYIKYDPTMADSTGPVIFQKSGPTHNSVITDSIVTIQDSLYDPSGIDSVYWTLNNSSRKSLVPLSGKPNWYSLTDTLRQFNLSTITVYAIDKATAHNKSSQTITLNHLTPPKIITQPASQSICPDQTAAFSIVVSGTRPLTYQWKKGSTTVGTDSTYTIDAVTAADTGRYTVTISNLADTITSSVAVLSLKSTSSKPTITPASPSICPGSPITLHLSGGKLGTGASWKWYKGSCGGESAGSDSTLTVSPTANTYYYVRAEGGCLNTDCAYAQVVMNTVPTVTTQPSSKTVWVTDTVSYSITAGGTAPLSYQWYHGATPIGANSTTIKINSCISADSGNYTCIVSNSCGKDTSEVGKLTVFYAKAAAAGGDHSLFLRSDNTLWACGYNNQGQLGDSTTATRLSPVKIMSEVQSMEAGDGYSLILKTDETLWACGTNIAGQFGNGTTAGQTFPVQILSGVKSVSTYNNFSLILKKDGTLLACGYNDYGQLGLGDNNERHSAEQVMTGVTAISAGYKHSLILKSDSLWSCGNNWYGQLADGSTTVHSSPFQTLLNSVQDIAAGGYFSLILKSNGTLLGCGTNGSGQLGQAEGINTVSPPTEILSGVKKIAAGNEFSIILLTDGTLKSCGANQYGQLGDGTNNNRFSPVLVTTNVQSIAAGGLHSLIIKADGTLWAFGQNSGGTLGDGTTTDRYLPVQIKF